ncbi:type II toxin-antitoxin system Phd/YefM family antitoxin [Occultella glacieicola]|uniref:Antitoxin n=1 Tax=Occultella glacieicola TaxID=2518684 RepID=A0ABY2E5J4_9MICO|nr:type II toxin-antitoxin system Phd/YefM family antitoxin [Occultella glacieicola]TDE95853.1 type II toxin-antitoxin system Phd/YefM family antitoxin [Occultella glacieicola]
MTTVTAAEFNQRPSHVKRAAQDGPVLITDHNRSAFVLLTYNEYQRLRGTPTNLVDWLEMDEDVEFEIEPIGLEVRPAAL